LVTSCCKRVTCCYHCCVLYLHVYYCLTSIVLKQQKWSGCYLRYGLLESKGTISLIGTQIFLLQAQTVVCIQTCSLVDINDAIFCYQFSIFTYLLYCCCCRFSITICQVRLAHHNKSFLYIIMPSHCRGACIKRCRDLSIHLLVTPSLGAQRLDQLNTQCIDQVTRAVRTADPSMHECRSTVICGGHSISLRDNL